MVRLRFAIQIKHITQQANNTHSNWRNTYWGYKYTARGKQYNRHSYIALYVIGMACVTILQALRRLAIWHCVTLALKLFRNTVFNKRNASEHNIIWNKTVSEKKYVPCYTKKVWIRFRSVIFHVSTRILPCFLCTLRTHSFMNVLAIM